MRRYVFDLASPADDAALRQRMAADVLDGSIAVTFRREPKYFDGTAVQGASAQVIKCIDRSDGHIVGLGARLLLPAYVNGQVRTLGYLCDLRAETTVRGATLLARGYRKLKSLHDAAAVELYYTCILGGNETALGILTSKRASLPWYRPAGRVLTPAIHLDRPRRYRFSRAIRIARASGATIAQVVAFLNKQYRGKQFAPVYNLNDLGSARLSGLKQDDIYVASRDGRIVGCVACWDQHSFRQIHVERYSRGLALARPLYNLLSSVTLRKPLPDIGGRIPFFYLAWTAVQNDDPAILRELIEFIYEDRRAGPWHFFIAGLHESSPMAEQLLEFRHIPSHGHLFVVHWEDGTRAYQSLDNRVPHIEVATL